MIPREKESPSSMQSMRIDVKGCTLSGAKEFEFFRAVERRQVSHRMRA